MGRFRCGSSESGAEGCEARSWARYTCAKDTREGSPSLGSTIVREDVDGSAEIGVSNIGDVSSTMDMNDGTDNSGDGDNMDNDEAS